MAPDKGNPKFHKNQRHKNDKALAIQSRTQSHRAILEKHKTISWYKAIFYKARIAFRIAEGTKKRFFYA